MSGYDEPGECGDWDAWELPLAVENAAQPLTIILARYPILEVRFHIKLRMSQG
jgi:hypothetical protein